MFKLGITGGIGAGKSTACKFFKNKGATIFNADEESKNHLNSNPMLQKKIMDSYGHDMFKNNQFNLIHLAEIAFSSSNNQKKLNEIMWPEVFKLIKIASTKAIENNCHLFIVDAALLFEAGNLDFFDSILLISASKEIRIKRIIERKGMSVQQINKRIKLQMNENEKKKRADMSIENNGDLQIFHDDLDFYHRNLQIH
jgi:dephospho-CoA kinase